MGDLAVSSLWCRLCPVKVERRPAPHPCVCLRVLRLNEVECFCRHVGRCRRCQLSLDPTYIVVNADKKYWPAKEVGLEARGGKSKKGERPPQPQTATGHIIFVKFLVDIFVGWWGCWWCRVNRMVRLGAGHREIWSNFLTSDSCDQKLFLWIVNNASIALELRLLAVQTSLFSQSK